MSKTITALPSAPGTAPGAALQGKHELTIAVNARKRWVAKHHADITDCTAVNARMSVTSSAAGGGTHGVKSLDNSMVCCSLLRSQTRCRRETQLTAAGLSNCVTHVSDRCGSRLPHSLPKHIVAYKQAMRQSCTPQNAFAGPANVQLVIDNLTGCRSRTEALFDVIGADEEDGEAQKCTQDDGCQHVHLPPEKCRSQRQSMSWLRAYYDKLRCGSFQNIVALDPRHVMLPHVKTQHLTVLCNYWRPHRR